jgi:(4S)-4-hydroxy-5-phosphonooxypentane-2,3-dione isomerase
MLIIHVQIQVKPDCIETFKEVTIENARNSRREPGIARFDVIQQKDDPTRFVLVEVYRSVESTAAHKATAHYAAWRDRAEPLMAGPRTRLEYTNVSPGDEGW